MTTPVFPTFPGVGWNILKTPLWGTNVVAAVSGREQRTALMALPLWKFELSYEVLRDYGAIYKAGGSAPELSKMVALFGQLQGQFGSFFFDDPDDNTATNQNFGTGDGVTTQFQLKRQYTDGTYTFTDGVYGVQPSPAIQIFDNGGAAGSNTISDTGLVTFSVAPLSGHALTWTGKFYFRLRFADDEQDFRQILKKFWELKKLSMISVKS